MLKESPERVTTNQLEQKTLEVPQEQIVTTPTTQQVTDQSATIEQLNTAARVVSVVNHIAKLTERERRAVELAKQKVDHSV